MWDKRDTHPTFGSGSPRIVVPRRPTRQTAAIGPHAECRVNLTAHGSQSLMLVAPLVISTNRERNTSKPTGIPLSAWSHSINDPRRPGVVAGSSANRTMRKRRLTAHARRVIVLPPLFASSSANSGDVPQSPQAVNTSFDWPAHLAHDAAIVQPER